LDRLGVSSEHTLIDLGAGTGALALEAAKRCRRVITVDVSSAMLAYIAARAKALRLDNVVGVNGGFLSYEHEGEPVDFILTKNAFHHLPDFWKVQALVRMRAILKQGGILHLQDLIFSFEPIDARSYIEAWLTTAPVDSAQGWSRPELVTHVREEYSTYSWLMEPMLERVGFSIRDASYSQSKIFAAYTCSKV
ncbi:MAG TPA: class I SAM-dependent methyltransferase, partial [Chloroflexota bacterium]|nr:class I SAM-dependent methyltransferase [Chloroflexota bacterium]